jgi:hypothetical protein
MLADMKEYQALIKMTIMQLVTVGGHCISFKSPYWGTTVSTGR